MGAGPPGGFVAQIDSRPRVLDRQGVAHSIGQIEPLVPVLKALDDSSGGIEQLNPFPAIVQTARIRTQNRQRAAVYSLEGGDVLDQQAITSRRQFETGEGVLDSLAESDPVQVDGLGTDVGQLDVLGV